MISMDEINTPYQYIITSFVFNTVLHHVGMLWIIETNQQFEYDMGADPVLVRTLVDIRPSFIGARLKN